MKFCRQIDKYNRIFYDPIKNEYLINGKEPIPISLGMEYQIVEVVEEADIAGLAVDEILYIIAGMLINTLKQ